MRGSINDLPLKLQQLLLDYVFIQASRTHGSQPTEQGIARWLENLNDEEIDIWLNKANRS